jgi:hypothetical protein
MSENGNGFNIGVELPPRAGRTFFRNQENQE